MRARIGKSRRIAATSSGVLTPCDSPALPFVISAICFYLNLAVHNADHVRLDRHDGRHARRAAGCDVEAGAVARALDLVTVKLALIERAAVVRADVVDA